MEEGALRYYLKPLIAFALCLLTAVMTEAADSTDQPPLLTTTLGVRAGDDTVEGFLDILGPIYTLKNGVIFLNPRAGLQEGGENEFNAGIGYRHFIPDYDLVFGANLYLDSRKTAYGNRFNQIGAGLECLTDWIDFRANYYYPEDDEALIRSYQTEETRIRTQTSINTTSQSSTRASSSTLAAGAPYPSGHSIWRDYITTTDYRITTRKTTTIRTNTETTTIRRLFEQFETALEGYDLELGLKLPVPEKLPEVKLFGGWCAFDSPYGEDINGWKGRLEARMGPYLTFDAEVYEDDQLNGSDYFIGARLQIPFDNFNFVQALKKVFTHQKRPSVRDRMHTEMVMRDVRVQTQASDFIENEAHQRTEIQTESRSDSRTTTTQAYRTQTQRAKEELASNITFTDGDNLTEEEDGTAEYPYNSVQEAVNNAGENNTIYVDSAAEDYHENVVLQDNQVLTSAIALSDGGVFQTVIPPTINGGSAPAITHAENTQVIRINEVWTPPSPDPIGQPDIPDPPEPPDPLEGITFVDGDNTSGVEDGTVEHPYNTIQEGIDSAGLDNLIFVDDAADEYLENVLLLDNQTLTSTMLLSDGNTYASLLPPDLDGGTSDAITLADGNTIERINIIGGVGGITGNGIRGATLIENVSIENVTGSGIDIQNSTGTITIEDATLNHSGDSGIRVDTFVGDFTVSDTGIYHSAADGIDIRNSTGAFTITDTVIQDSGDNGVRIDNFSSEFIIDAVTIHNSGNFGIDIHDSMGDFTIADAEIHTTADSALNILNYDGSFTMNGGDIQDSGNYGVLIKDSSGDYTFNNVTISEILRDGIACQSALVGSKTDLLIQGCTISDSDMSQSGVLVEGENDVVICTQITNSVFNANVATPLPAIDILVHDTAQAGAVVMNNVISGLNTVSIDAAVNSSGAQVCLDATGNSDGMGGAPTGHIFLNNFSGGILGVAQSSMGDLSSDNNSVTVTPVGTVTFDATCCP